MSVSSSSKLFVFKHNKLLGYIQDYNFYKYDEYGNPKMSNDELNKIIDLIPEGIDYTIMARSFNFKKDIDILYYLKNPIGAYSFSENFDNIDKEYIISDDISCNDVFPNILNMELQLTKSELYPNDNQNISNTRLQRFSISGQQHKLQAYIKNNKIFSGYGDYILKPDSIEYFDIPMNEHLHTTFMREFGFEAPLNGLIFDEKNKVYHYLIKRFDVIDECNKKEQYSINALMKLLPRDKYEGGIEDICEYINSTGEVYSKDERLKFLKYVFANALLYNSDMHKKNINFFCQEGRYYLTPAYDVLNIYAIKANLGDSQVALQIGHKSKKIGFKDFSKSIKILGLDEKAVFDEFEKIARIYFVKYPLYLEKLYNSQVVECMKHKDTFFTKALDSYNQNLFVYSKEITNIELFSESKFALESVKKLAKKSDCVKELVEKFLNSEAQKENQIINFYEEPSGSGGIKP